MKKTIFLFITLGITSLCWSQEITDINNKKNEVKANVFNLIAVKFLDLSYEYLLNEEGSLGMSLLFNLSDSDKRYGYKYRKFSITTYYRQFLFNKNTKGFFIEGFGMLNSREDKIHHTPNNGGSYEGDISLKQKNYTDFALGFSLGSKIVTKRGLVAEIYCGVGRNLLNNNSSLDIVIRAGLSLGVRF